MQNYKNMRKRREHMKKLTLLLVAAVMVVSFSAIAHADLSVVGTGYMTSDPTQTQYQLIYDSAQNITWYDYTNSLNTWQNQVNWASGLTVNFKSQSLTGWSLPSYSELGVLYSELGGTAGLSPPPTMPFQNLNGGNYWSGDELVPGYSAWGFNFTIGYPFVGNESANPLGGAAYAQAIAIRPGDVAATPIPGTVLLFASGLAGLVGMKWRLGHLTKMYSNLLRG